MGCDNKSGRGTGGDFLGEGWAAQNRAGVFGNCGYDLGHAEVGDIFYALAGADDDLIASEQRGDMGQDPT